LYLNIAVNGTNCAAKAKAAENLPRHP